MGEPWDVYNLCDGCGRTIIDDEIDTDGNCIYCGDLVNEPEEEIENDGRRDG